MLSDSLSYFTAHVDYLKTLKEGWLFFEKGYDILTDRTDFKNRDTAQAFVYVILLIAIACGICGADYANHEIRLLRTTRRGRKQHMGIKCILGFLGTVAALHLYILCGCAMCFRHMARRGLMLRRQVWSICGVFRRIYR